MALGIPVLMALLYGWPSREFFTPAQLQLYAAAAAGSLGLVTFLIYSELQFGQWDTYFSYVTQAWQTDPQQGMALNPASILLKFRWPEHLSGQISNFLLLFMLPVIAYLTFISCRDQSRQRYLVLTTLYMIILYYYFYSTLPQSVGEGITNYLRHLVPVIGMCTILLLVARPRKPDWLPSWALVTLLVAFLSVEFFFQKQLLDLFRFGYWIS
jgi:hypothetical protein